MMKSIRNPKDWLEKAQEIALLGNWDQDPATGELWWSDQTYRLFGLDPQEQKMTFEYFLEMVHPEDRALVIDKTEQVLCLKDSDYEVEYRIVMVNQPLRHVYETAHVEYDEQGKPTKIIGIIQDISKRKENEIKLNEAYRDLKNSQAQLLHAEKMASIGQLAAGVAHEINNPLGFISSNLNSFRKYTSRLDDFLYQQKVILETIGNDISSEVADQLLLLRKKMKIDYILEDLNDLITESQEGTERVSSIVKTLKNFSRIDELAVKPTDINKCIHDTLRMLNNEFNDKVDIETNFIDIPETSCNAGELNQVFTNLLLNASQAIEIKGNIKIKTWAEKQQIIVSIADTGVGIPSENLSRIFDPFFTTKPVGQGTGLGLGIVHDIVTKHKGTIHVCSTPNIGTQFILKLPIID